MNRTMNRLDRLVIIIYSDLLASGGGRETWLSQFLSHALINKQFYAIDIIAAESTGESSEKLTFKKNIRTHSIDVGRYASPLRIIRFMLHSRKTLAELKDGYGDGALIIGVGSFNENIAAIFSKSSSDIVCCWIRGIWEKEISYRHSKLITRIIVSIERFFLKKSDMVLANGVDTHLFYKSKGISSKVIDNGINLSRFKVGSKVDEVRIAFVGRLSREKGIGSFLDAMRIVANSLKTNITFIGHGPEMPEVQKFVTEFPAEARYLGSISNQNIPEVLSSIDISFHLTGSADVGGGGVSHSIIEAMAAGHRIVCWDNAIFRQLKGAEAFYFVEEGNIAELAHKTESAIADCLSNETKRQEIISRNLHNYSFETHVRRFLELTGLRDL